MLNQAQPISILTATLLFGLAQAGLVIWLSLWQPWLGSKLVPGPDDSVMVAAVAAAGPLAQAVPGSRLVAIGAGGAAADPFILQAQDRIEEPDLIAEPQDLVHFFERQGFLSNLLRNGPVAIKLESPAGMQNFTAMPADHRPLGDLPLEFWVQLCVGLAGIWLGGWIVALRFTDRAAWMFWVAGVGLALSAHAAAFYSTRELALPSDLFRAASKINTSGTLVFGIGMITLFLIYPTQLVRGVWLWLPTVAIGGWLLWILLDRWPEHLPSVQLAIVLSALCLLATILVQFYVNRRNPSARAMLGWFGLSVIVGAGGFILSVIVPSLAGLEPALSQGQAFVLFLAIYIGLAMGIARYRLFDLSDWAFRLLFYVGGVGLLLGLDLLLVLALPIERIPALTLSLALVGLIYLPMRNRLAAWFRPSTAMPAEQLYSRITQIAHSKDPARRSDALSALLTDMFSPLVVEPLASAAERPLLRRHGEAMEIPRILDIPPRLLMWAGSGTRLFSSRDLARARSLAELLSRAIHQHDAYTHAVEEERGRINRDMHDNIGVLLLGALHSSDPDRKNRLIRQTLTDLREIISNPLTETLTLSRLVSDLRAEISELLEASGIDLHWSDADLPDISLTPQLVHTLRSLLREGSSNLVRHSGATSARIGISTDGDDLAVMVEDDGKGFEDTGNPSGNGLTNLRDRITQCGGAFECVMTAQGGTRLRCLMPIRAPGMIAMPSQVATLRGAP